MPSLDKESRLAGEAAAAAKEAEEKAKRLDPLFPYRVIPFDAAFWLANGLDQARAAQRVDPATG